MEVHHLSFLNTTGEIGTFIKEKDWRPSGLGKLETWPQSLCTSLSIILATPTPMLLFWGSQQICFFNTAFLKLQTHKKFINLLGQPGSIVFPETWIIIYQEINKVLEGEKLGESENFHIPNLNNEWDFNYSRVYDELGNSGAVLVSGRHKATTYETNLFQVDASEHQRNKINLEKKEAEITAIIENSMFPIAVIKVDTMEILRANDVVLKIWGKGKNIIGKKYTDILPELEVQEVFKYFHQVTETGKTFEAFEQKVNLVKNGESVIEYFNYCLAPLKDENGKVYAILNTAVDITEVTEARLKIEATVNDLKLFKFMADNAADKLILIRKDASFAYVNNRVLSKWGYTKKEIEQLSVFDVDTLYNKKDFDKMFETTFKNHSLQFETNHKNKQGEIFPVEVSVTGLLLDEEPFIFVISRDISERKKTETELKLAFTKIENSEKRFRDSVKQAPLGIAIFKGEQFVSEMVNNDYYKLIDRTEEQFLNRPLFEALPEVKEAVEPIFREIYKTGKPYHNYEFPIYLKKSSGIVLAYFNLVYHPLKDENGTCNGIMVVAVEVTENVIAKKKLQESEKQFRNMVIRSPVAITILRGEDFIIETANKMMLKKIMGYEEKDVIGKPLFNVFPEMKKQDFPALLKSVFKRGKNLNIDEGLLILNRENGAEDKMIADISFTPMPATENTVAAIMVTASIVTEKVEARKNVEHSNERLRLATEAAEMGTFELDLITKELIHSPQLALIFGEHPDKSFKYEVLRNKIIEKDLEEIVVPAFELSVQTGSYFYEARIRKTPATINWIRTQGKVVFDKNKNPIKMMGTTVDITESKLFTEKLEKSEERFRLLANEVPQFIWTADAQGKIFYFNESVFNYSGLNKDVLYTDGWIEIVHPDDRDENVRLWMEAITNGNDFLFEHRFRRSDGIYRWQLSRAVAQRNEHGEIQAWVGSSTDIQDIKEQEQQKDFFISMASHELKTPVTSIKGYVQVLQSMYEKSDDVFLKDSLGVVDRQIITLTKLISELLDISKIKSGSLDVIKEEFEMPELIKEITQQVMHTSPQYNIELDIIPSAKLFADRDRIGQVLINLFTNAIKYAPNAKNIEVTCKMENGFVIISVKDEGIGISKANQEKVFDRFYRVDGKSEQTYPGFGIGLFIASEIIKKHNGTIKVESELGKGSRFSFCLPMVK